jgi:hypothetical protein
MVMRDPDDVALDEIANALDDPSAEVSYGHSWWFDPSTAEVRFHRADVDDDTADDLDGAGLVHIDALPSFVGYGDMEDFIEDVSDPRARDLLERAIEGRGAFRRFNDRLFEFPELRERWYAFRDVRLRGRAVVWLTERLISDQARHRGDGESPRPPVGRQRQAERTRCGSVPRRGPSSASLLNA